MCLICQEAHQVSAIMPPELVNGASDESQLLAGSMLVTMEMAMAMVRRVLKEAHGVEVEMNIKESE